MLMTYTTTYVPSRPPLPPTPTLSIFVHRELLSALISAPHQNAPTLGESAKAVNWCVLQPLQVS